MEDPWAEVEASEGAVAPAVAPPGRRRGRIPEQGQGIAARKTVARESAQDPWSRHPNWQDGQDPWAAVDSHRLVGTAVPSAPGVPKSRSHRRKCVGLSFQPGSSEAALALRSHLVPNTAPQDAFGRSGSDPGDIERRWKSGLCKCTSAREACHRGVSLKALIIVCSLFWRLAGCEWAHLLRTIYWEGNPEAPGSHSHNPTMHPNLNP
jgi:hypothetical protein